MVDYVGGVGVWGPPVWLYVEPAVGKKILVTLRDFPDSEHAQFVLDLDSPDAQWLPVIERIIAPDRNPLEERKRRLTKLLKDPSPVAHRFGRID